MTDPDPIKLLPPPPGLDIHEIMEEARREIERICVMPPRFLRQRCDRFKP